MRLLPQQHFYLHFHCVVRAHLIHSTGVKEVESPGMTKDGSEGEEEQGLHHRRRSTGGLCGEWEEVTSSWGSRLETEF